jgi:DNA replication protein
LVDGNGVVLRKYREGNITAAFGTDLFIHGITFVPNMLLEFYPRMGLDESEVMLLIHLLRMRAQDKNLYPSREELGECLSGGVEQVDRDLARLREKKILAVTDYYLEDKKTVTEGYDFEVLFERLSELWACSKVSEIERAKDALEKEDGELENPELGKLYEAFAGEFGRPLSPIEVDQIDQWHSKVGPILAREALRRSVLLGKYNFRYIDSIILEWQKNRLLTLEEITAYEKDFQQRRNNKKAPRKTTVNNRDKEIALIKTLYMS